MLYAFGPTSSICLVPTPSVAHKYHKRIADFEAFVPLIRALRTNGMRQRHWARLFEEIPSK